ncbi:MAG TPA: hypothetical protein VIV11_18945 [Kofleriaceae bacterium]
MSARKVVEPSNRKLAIVLASATAAVLVAMVVVAGITGASQEPHEHFNTPDAYAKLLLEQRSGLRVMMALDIAFCILYTAFFAALARHLGGLFAWLGFGAMVLVALLDFVEDHHIIAMLESVEHGIVPAADAIAWQAAESATKFSISYLSLVLFGLAIPRTTKLARTLVTFLTVGTVITAIVGYSLPPGLQPAFEGGRGIGFLVGLGLAIAWLSREPDAR